MNLICSIEFISKNFNADVHLTSINSLYSPSSFQIPRWVSEDVAAVAATSAEVAEAEETSAEAAEVDAEAEEGSRTRWETGAATG